MTIAAWVAVCVTIAIAVLGGAAGALRLVFRRIERSESMIKAWCRDVFAEKDSVARLEERMTALENLMREVRDTTHEILQRLSERR